MSLSLPTGQHLFDGPEGTIEVLVDAPLLTQSAGLVILAHPQPLLGGSAKHKVPHFLAKSLTESGWLVVRPNFRGVGRSAGVHDAGEGETRDLLWLTYLLRRQAPELPLVLLGISFGAFVQARVADALQAAGEPASRVILAAMPWGEVEGGRTYDTPQGLVNAKVIHGEMDERVPLKAVFDWARPTSQPVCVLTGADHLFSGNLHHLRAVVLDAVS
jgi:alpha/beta superfamily hydrolase